MLRPLFACVLCLLANACAQPRDVRAGIDPQTCWRRPIFIKSAEGVARLRGIEDLELDRQSDRLLGAAYDHLDPDRAPQGIVILTPETILTPPHKADLQAWRKRGIIPIGFGAEHSANAFIELSAPHGLALGRNVDGALQIATFSRHIAGGKRIGADLVVLSQNERGSWKSDRFVDPAYRYGNELAWHGTSDIFLTLDRSAGKNSPGGHVARLRAGQLRIFAPRFTFANGIALSADGRSVWLSDTRMRKLHRLSIAALELGDPSRIEREAQAIRLPANPDNIHMATEAIASPPSAQGRASGAETIWVASYPDFWRFVAHRLQILPAPLDHWLGFDRSGTRIIRLTPDPQKPDRWQQRIMLDLRSGSRAPFFSAASIAILWHDHLVLGGVLEEGLFVCPMPSKNERARS